MSESIKKNFAYKSVLTVSTYLVSLLIYPYVSRVLGVENIGLVNFVDNTISYFLLFATMGVNILGVREIAYVKNDREHRSDVFSSILGINLVLTIATLIVYYLAIAFIPQLNQSKELFYIGSAKILFTAFLIEWLFTGIENFKYITIRTIIIKIIYAILVFIFVRESDDYVVYFIMTAGVVVINALINLAYSLNFVKINIRKMFSFGYLKEDLSLGIYAIMTSMYISFNVIFLGFMSNNTEVGYYTTAFKIYNVILGLFSAFTSVMLPRMSALLSQGDGKTFQCLTNRSFSLVSMFSFPVIMSCAVLAPDIIYIISGPGYEGAILPMRIIMPAILFVGIAQVLAIQVITPLKKDKVLLSASIAGASLSLILNILLVPNLKSVGSAIVLLCSEFVVTGVYVMYACKVKLVTFPIRLMLEFFITSVPSVVLCILCIVYIENIFIRFPIAIVASISVWSILNARKISNIVGIDLTLRRHK